jgi:hypothetical protein
MVKKVKHSLELPKDEREIVLFALLVFVATVWSNRVLLVFAVKGFVDGPPALYQKSRQHSQAYV